LNNCIYFIYRLSQAAMGRLIVAFRPVKLAATEEPLALDGSMPMQRMDQLLLQRLLQNDSTSWIQVVYLAAMFAVVMWRKDSIVNWGMFRASYIFYGISLVAPAIVLPLLQWMVPGAGFPGAGPSSYIGTQIFMNAVGPTCFALAVVCGLGCMAPRRVFASRPVPTTPHPLD
jgi:hypothetical protein